MPAKVGHLIALKELARRWERCPEVARPLWEPGPVSVLCDFFMQLLTATNVPPSEFLEVLECFAVTFDLLGSAFGDPAARKALIEIAGSKLTLRDPRVHVLVYKLLFAVFRRFYAVILENMAEMFAVTHHSLELPDADFVIPALDFWKKVAEFEFGLRDSQRVIVTASGSLIPLLFACLVRFPVQEMAIDDCGPNIAFEAGVALNRVARVFTDGFHTIVEFATAMVQAGDWQTRAGGYAAFLSAVDGGPPHEARVFFVNRLHLFIAAIPDESAAVRCAAISVVSACISAFPELVNDSSRMLAMFRQIQACTAAGVVTEHRSLELLGQFIATVQQTGRLEVFDAEYPALLGFLRRRLEEALESPAPIISEIGIVFDRFVRMTPEDHLSDLAELLGHVLQRIQTLGELLAGILDRAQIELNLASYCAVTFGIAARLGPSIAPYVVYTLPILVKCLDLHSPTVYEEAILAVGKVMEYSGDEGRPFIGAVVRHVLLSQISQSPTITALGAICMRFLMNGHGPALDDFAGEVMAAFRRNVDDDFVPMKTKVDLLLAMATVIERTGRGAGFWEFFLGELEKFARLPLTEPADREEGGALMTAVLGGYRTLLIVAHDDAFLEAVFRRFKVIGLMIEKRAEFYNRAVAETLTGVMEEIIGARLAKTVNSLIHRRTIQDLIGRAWTEFGIERACIIRQKLKEM
jgi:hypothetical protein